MSLVNNPWVGYIDRSYQQIKKSVVDKLVIKAPEIKDHSETNPLIIIVGLFAGIAEMLNYYIDSMARESFIATARRMSSVIKLTKILDYRIRARIAATVDLEVTFIDNANNPIALTSAGLIPQGTIFGTVSGVRFRITEDHQVPINTTAISIGASQVVSQENVDLGNTSGVANEVFVIGTDYVDGTMEISVNSLIFTRESTLGLSGPTDRVFIVDIDTDGNAKVIFGDGVNGQIPPSGFPVIANYFSSDGSGGNVDPDTITELIDISGIVMPGANSVQVNNPLAAVGGAMYESLESIKRRAPLSIRTLDRAVSEQDYRDIAALAPGVRYGDVEFNCNGKQIKVYIAPSTLGIAQTPLLNSTWDFFQPRKIAGRSITVLPAGITYIRIELDVTARRRVAESVAISDIQTKLLDDTGNYRKSDINKDFRLSDMIADVDNLPRVDYLTPVHVSTVPYARPTNVGSVALNWDVETLTGSNAINTWRLEKTATTFRIYKNSQFLSNVSIGSSYTDPNNIIQFTINPGLYPTGHNWEFKTYPANKDIVLEDFTVPVIILDYLTINVTTQS